MIFSKKTAEPETIKIENPELLDMLAPTCFDDSAKRYLAVSDHVRDVHFIRDYAPMVDVNWLDVAFNRPRSITTIAMQPSDRAKLSRAIDHSDARQGVKLAGTGAASDEEEALRTREHGRSMLRIMGDTNESFFETVIFQQLVEDDERALKAHDKTFASLAGGAMLTTEVLAGAQHEAYLAASPYWVNPTSQFKMWGRDICTTTIAASLPFQDDTIDDGVGNVLGVVKPQDSICRLNMMKPAQGRTNMNCFVAGASGSGKTNYICNQIYQELALGAKVIILDYERTFRNGARHGGGQWVDMGRGAYTTRSKTTSGAWLSPLQPRLGTIDPDAQSGEDGTTEVLRATMNFIHGWAELAWSLGPEDMPYLDKGLVRAYARYGITMETNPSDLKKDCYPVFEDLVCVFDQLEKEALADNHIKDAERYHSMAMKSYSCMPEGAYGNLWGRRSNVDIANDFVVFDVYELSNVDANVRTAQLFSILTWIWSEACVSRVTKQFLRVVLDEGHMLFNSGEGTRSLMAAQFVNMMQKRIRKYNGGLLFATQNVQDVLAPEVIRYGEALITSSAYKLFFRTDTTDLDRICETMRLSEFVRCLITNFNAGDCLLSAGDTMAQVHIDRKDYIVRFWEDGSKED